MNFSNISKMESLVFLLFLSFMVMLAPSCSTLLGVSSELGKQDTTYFAPNFYNGKIIALRHTWGPEKDPGSGRSPYDYVIFIDFNEASKETSLREIFGSSSVTLQLEASPLLSYIGLLISYESAGTTNYSVEIYTQEAQASTYYPQSVNLSYEAGILPTSMKFSPDETKLAISFGNEKFIITDLKGNIQKEYLLGGNFIWKSNNEGFFYKKTSSRLALINLSDDNITLYDVDILPMTYNSSEEVIYSLSGNTFEAYKLGSTEVERKTLNFDPAKYVFPHISSDGKKVVLTSTPYNPPDGSSYPRGGIYLIDVAENVLKEIRYYTDEKIILSK